MQHEGFLGCSARPHDVQCSDLQACVETQAFPTLPAGNTPSDTTALLPPSPNRDLPWLFEQRSRQPPTAKAEVQKGHGACGTEAHIAYSNCPLLHIPITADQLSAYDYGLRNWQAGWNSGMLPGTTSLQSMPGSMDDFPMSLLDLATPRAQDVQPPQLSALESQGKAGAGAGNVHHFSSGGGPPAQALPDEAESAPGAARQRRSKRGAGGAKPGATQAPADAKSDQHSVPGIIRGASQDFTYDPETGRKLRFGPAMTARMATVELPLVTALFADISAAGPKRQRAWTAAAPQPAGAKRASSSSLPQRGDPPLQQQAAPLTPGQATARLHSALRSLRGTPPDQAPPTGDRHGSGGAASAAHTLQEEQPGAEAMWLDIMEGCAGDTASSPDELTWPLWLPHEAAPLLLPMLSWPSGSLADGMQSPVFGEGLNADVQLIQTADPAASLQPMHVPQPLAEEQRSLTACEPPQLRSQRMPPPFAPQPQAPPAVLPKQAPLPLEQPPSAMAAPSELSSQQVARSAPAPRAATRRTSGRHAGKKQQPSKPAAAPQDNTPPAQRRKNADHVKLEEPSTGKGSVLGAQEGCRPVRRRRSTASLAAQSSQSARTGETSLASRLAGPPLADARPVPTESVGWADNSSEHRAGLAAPAERAAAAAGEPGSRFGCITQSVIQAAARGGGKKAPVFRLEELHRVAQQPAVLGVTRSPWSITWDAHVASAAAGTDCGGANLGADTAGLSMKDADKVFLGSFASPATAARAHDVAALRISCGYPSQAPTSAPTAAVSGSGILRTNYPAAGYEEGLTETKGASIADFIVALQRHGAFDSQRGSRYRGVLKLGDKQWEARYEEPATESVGG